MNPIQCFYHLFNRMEFVLRFLTPRSSPITQLAAGVWIMEGLKVFHRTGIGIQHSMCAYVSGGKRWDERGRAGYDDCRFSKNTTTK